MKRKMEYILVILIACAISEFALFNAWYWFWSGFPWSPFGYETCGLISLVFSFFVWPALILSELIRLGLLYRWRFPKYVWLLHFATVLVAIPISKGFTGGILAALLMVLIPAGDLYSMVKAERKS